MTKSLTMKCACCLVMFCCALGVAAEPPAPFALKSTIALPGVEGRFDHAAMDPATHRLYVMSGPRRGQPGSVKVLVFGPP